MLGFEIFSPQLQTAALSGVTVPPHTLAMHQHGSAKLPRFRCDSVKASIPTLASLFALEPDNITQSGVNLRIRRLSCIKALLNSYCLTNELR